MVLAVIVKKSPDLALTTMNNGGRDLAPPHQLPAQTPTRRLVWAGRDTAFAVDAAGNG